MRINTVRLAWATGTLALLIGCSGTYSAGMDPANSAGAGGASAGGSPASKAGSSSTAGAIGNDSSPSGDAGDSSSSSSGTAGAPGFCGVALVSAPAPAFASPTVVAKRIRLFLTNGQGDMGAALPQVTTRDWAGALAISILDGQTNAPGMTRFMSSLLPGTPIASTWGGYFSVPGATLKDLLTSQTVLHPGAGILTDVAVLNKPGLHISGRGGYLMSHLVCRPAPLPPAGLPNPPAAMPGQTRRQQLEQSIAAPSCAACHHVLDPLGLGLEHFDTVGAYGDLDNGSTIDSSSSLDLSEGTITFADANEMGNKLAHSCEVASCVAQQMLADAEGSAALPQAGSTDPAAVAAIASHFNTAGGDLHDLIRQIVQSDTFLRAP